MRSINKVILMGNLTREPEVRQTTGGQTVATFSVATNRYWKGNEGNQNEETEYHDIVAWGKLAEICQAYLKTGTAVYVEGRLKTRSWEGQDGHKRYKTEIILSDLNIISRKKDGDGNDDNVDKVLESSADTDSGLNNQAASTADDYSDEKINIEDIPF
jgi:single-strand DNA-binding protein